MTSAWSWWRAQPDRCRHHATAKSWAEAGGRPVAQYAVPDFHIASRIVASLRLTATIAFFIDVRFAILSPQAFNGDMTRARPRILAAASNSMTRTCGSPALVIRPVMSVMPDCHRRGVSPAQAPTSRLRGKRSGLSTALRKVSATITPTPGVVISSRVTGSDFAIAVSWSSMPASSSRSRARTRSMASTIPSRTVLPSANSRARGAHVFRVTDPIFSPKFLRAARSEFSVAVTFSTKNVRAVSSARVSCESSDFT